MLGGWISGTLSNILGQSAALRESDIRETGRQADTRDTRETRSYKEDVGYRAGR